MEKKQLVKPEIGEIIKDKPDGIYLGEFKITQQEIVNLQEEIKYLEKTRIWSVLTNTLAEDARQVMFEKAQNFDDMRNGKAILYAIDRQNKIMKRIKTLVAK